jgi:hypothetical protein
MATKKEAQAEAKNKEGLKLYDSWEVEGAIMAFREAVAADYDNPEYHLNLARAYARSSDYHQAITALGDYLRTEKDEAIAERYERMFSSALDNVETRLIEAMKKMGMSVQQIGKGIHMWLEFRIAYGRRPLRIKKPETWAAALAYAIAKVNLLDVKRPQILQTFKVDASEFEKIYEEIIGTLDVMPADYRYFAGENNPLDKLVEAARMLEDLDNKFQTHE